MQAKSSTNPFKATPDLWQVSFVTKFSNISKLDLIFEETAEAISSNEISSSHIEHRPDDLWRYNCFFQAEPTYNEIYNLTASYRIGDLQITKEDEKDWVLAVQENMKPIYVGGFFIYHKIGLKPIEDNFVPIYINPGRAFGTGEHPTTNLCLQFISECKLDPNYVLDMGCGSGILSFACKKLWPASQIIGVDTGQNHRLLTSSKDFK
ncbi:MAG: hypothetical protein EBU93_06760 [Chlamydiae bacterium]|nr:hypothetical protein [Chlamydiota bacterium]